METRLLYFYFAPLTFLIFFGAPEVLLDIPVSYVLKNQLNASADEVSLFRLVAGIPLYLSFLFGLARDMWSPFGWRDKGYFCVFLPLTIGALVGMAHSPVGYWGLLAWMLLATISFRFVMAAYQGFIATVAQQTRAPGRLGTLFNLFSSLPLLVASLGSGLLMEYLATSHIFYLNVIILFTITILFYGAFRVVDLDFGKCPSKIKQMHFFNDIRRLAKHKAIYPAILINLLWNCSPGLNTPLQFYFADKLHASDAVYGYFQAIACAASFPTMILYGVLCTRIPLRKLLWLATAVGIPSTIPILFVQSVDQALAMAVPVGFTTGLACGAFLDLAIRSCPPRFHGTLMMLVSSANLLSTRAGDVLGTNIFSTSDHWGFLYCVLFGVGTTTLILLVIPFVPKHLVLTTDGEPNARHDISLR